MTILGLLVGGSIGLVGVKFFSISGFFLIPISLMISSVAILLILLNRKSIKLKNK